jgi:uncharacterized protein YukE
MSNTIPIDSAALQAEAARLRSIAETISERSRRLEQRIATLDFQGPAGDRLRVATADQTARATRVAGQLEELADLLLRRAHAAS